MESISIPLFIYLIWSRLDVCEEEDKSLVKSAAVQIHMAHKLAQKRDFQDESENETA